MGKNTQIKESKVPSPTLETFNRIVVGLKKEGISFSANFIVRKYHIQLKYARAIIGQLLNEDKIEKVKTSGCGEFYRVKNEIY